jgi:hypothetical protein
MPRKSLNGVRVHLQFTKPQYANIQKLSKQSGLSISELMRRAIDVYLHQQEKNKK